MALTLWEDGRYEEGVSKWWDRRAGEAAWVGSRWRARVVGMIMRARGSRIEMAIILWMDIGRWIIWLINN